MENTNVLALAAVGAPRALEREAREGTAGKFQPEMCGELIKLMAQGWTKTEVATALGVHRQTLRRWVNPQGEYYQPEFAEAMSKGMTACGAWWEGEGRDNLMNRNFNTGLFALMMANMFGWRSASKRKTQIEEEIESIKRELGIAE
jgi:hypothetical protein